jgi:hypothetical protein
VPDLYPSDTGTADLLSLEPLVLANRTRTSTRTTYQVLRFLGLSPTTFRILLTRPYTKSHLQVGIYTEALRRPSMVSSVAHA